MEHLLSVPPGEAARPLICFLHGYDEAAPAPPQEALTRHGPFRPGNPAQVASEFILLAPQLPLGGDLWHRYADEVRRLVATTVKRHGADRSRLYLTGFSFGGNGVFDFALLQPGLWAALWAVDPTRVPAADPQRPLWLSFGEVARQRKAAFVRALGLQPFDSAPPGERAYADHGDDHVGAARRAYGEARIYDWLLARRLAFEDA
jgi:hypothetical protein